MVTVSPGGKRAVVATLCTERDVDIRPELISHGTTLPAALVGGEVVDRVLAGESLIITRSGKPVAELRPIRQRRLDATALLERWSKVPRVDPKALRHDIDLILDPSI